MTGLMIGRDLGRKSWRMSATSKPDRSIAPSVSRLQ